jgi:hypothetical protein
VVLAVAGHALGHVRDEEPTAAAAEPNRRAVREDDLEGGAIVAIVAISEGFGFGDAADFHGFPTV